MDETIHRRRFLGQTVGSASGLALSTTAALAQDNSLKQITVGVVTNAEGAHLGAYFAGLASCESVGSVVLSDPDNKVEPQARKALGNKLTKVYQDRVEMLRTEKPVMVLVSLEAKLAAAAIDDCLEAGCHVMAEKPACLSVAEFEPLVKKSTEKQLHLMLALANRLNPEMLEARRLVSTGQIGRVYGLELHLIEDQTRLTRKSYQASWYAQKTRAGGGHLSWLGIHWLDLSMYITGSKIKRVAGFKGNVGGQPIDIEDSVAMTMQYDNGTFGTMTSGYYLDSGYQSHIKIWGSEGWLRVESDSPRSLTWYRTKHSKSPAGEVFQGSSNHNAYTTFVDAAVKASAGLQTPPIDGHDALAVLKTVYGLYQAAESSTALQI